MESHKSHVPNQQAAIIAGVEGFDFTTISRVTMTFTAITLTDLRRSQVGSRLGSLHCVKPEQT